MVQFSRPPKKIQTRSFDKVDFLMEIVSNFEYKNHLDYELADNLLKNFFQTHGMDRCIELWQGQLKYQSISRPHYGLTDDEDSWLFKLSNKRFEDREGLESWLITQSRAWSRMTARYNTSDKYLSLSQTWENTSTASLICVIGCIVAYCFTDLANVENVMKVGILVALSSMFISIWRHRVALNKARSLFHQTPEFIKIP